MVLLKFALTATEESYVGIRIIGFIDLFGDLDRDQIYLEHPSFLAHL